MSRILIDRLLLCLVPLLLLAAGPAQALRASDGRVLEDLFRQSVLSFDETAEFGCPILQIYVAENPSQRARGLMFVRALPVDWGMLFLYDGPRTISMYMKNTFIPLDMVFIDQSGVVVDVVTNTEPGSLKSITPRRRAAAVLEINAGLAAQLGIRPGSRARHEAFGDTSQ